MTYSKTRATKDNNADYTHSPHAGTNGTAPAELGVGTTVDLDLQETQVVPSAAEVRDRFAAPEYVNPNARLPRIQALRGGVIRSV
jgi:hypothetical protein